MTEKQRVVYDKVVELHNEAGVDPTVRSLTDRLETRRFRAARFTDGSVRSLLTRLERDGHVRRMRTDKGVRFEPVSS